MRDINNIIANYWNDLGYNEDDRAWLDALSSLRSDFLKKVDQLEKTIILLESLHCDRDSQKTYKTLLAACKKTYVLTDIKEFDSIGQQKYVIKIRQGGSE